jgi:hypothetical protein
MLVHIKLFLKESILAQTRGEKVGAVSLFGGARGHCSDIYAQLNVSCNLHDYTLMAFSASGKNFVHSCILVHIQKRVGNS